jgi:large subunit ribosomal protein L13
MKTVFVKPKDVERKWYVVNAEGVPLGRVAAKVAYILRGKHKPFYTPHQEIGDYVIVVNSEKAVVTGGKAQKKVYYKHTGHPGGIKSETYGSLISRRPTIPMEKAIKGMLPKGPLGRKLFRNVKVYAGATHPHASQQPKALEI